MGLGVAGMMKLIVSQWIIPEKFPAFSTGKFSERSTIFCLTFTQASIAVRKLCDRANQPVALSQFRDYIL